jgi:hypothetical protein
MNADGRRIVQVSAERVRACSERIMYAAIALAVLPLAAEVPESSTTCPTPARSISATTASMSLNPGSRKTPRIPVSATRSDVGSSRSAATTSAPATAVEALRLSARTGSPASTSARATSAPTLPVTPVTRNAALPLLETRRDVAGEAAGGRVVEVGPDETLFMRHMIGNDPYHYQAILAVSVDDEKPPWRFCPAGNPGGGCSVRERDRIPHPSASPRRARRHRRLLRAAG